MKIRLDRTTGNFVDDCGSPLGIDCGKCDVCIAAGLPTVQSMRDRLDAIVASVSETRIADCGIAIGDCGKCDTCAYIRSRPVLRIVASVSDLP